AEFRDLYATLHAAQAEAVAAATVGTPCEDVDGVARRIITDGGYGPYFIHRTGHGIGLEAHEEPWIVSGNDTVLEAGMCFSIEPGIYLPGRHGARIEDIVTVSQQGVERLDTIDRELVVLA
ncbi:MAG: hypothetical protein QOJ03_1790, partial [Frankiaceae bacterium]|nr:hypothetical protein [Frankiaceae bacterium]